MAARAYAALLRKQLSKRGSIELKTMRNGFLSRAEERREQDGARSGLRLQGALFGASHFACECPGFQAEPLPAGEGEREVLLTIKK